RLRETEVPDAKVVEHLPGVDRSPTRRIGPSVVVVQLRVMTLVEPDAHGALALPAVAVVRLAQAVAHVVINDAVVDESPFPIELVAAVLVRLRNLKAAVIRDAVIPVGLARDERIDRKRMHHLARVLVPDALGANAARRDPVGRHAAVYEEREVELRIVRVGHDDRRAPRVLDTKAIAKESPVDLTRKASG